MTLHGLPARKHPVSDYASAQRHPQTGFLLGAAIALALALHASPQARAQQVAADQAASAEAQNVSADRSRRVIEEVIVTAQRREQRLRDVPIAISAFSGEELSNLGITDTQDLQRIVPGLNINESGRGSMLFTLRGVGFTDTTYTATSTVGTYVDEVSIPYSVMIRGNLVDVQRVEVLKGPQGTLYGRNTTGGLINYVPERPTDEFEAGISLAYSRFDQREIDGFVSGPLFTDRLRGRLAINTLKADKPWQKSQTRGDRLGKKDRIAGRLSLDWDVRENLEILFRVEGWRDKSDPHAPQVVGIVPGNPFVGELGLNPEIRDYPFFGSDADPRLADWPVEAPFFPGQMNDRFLMSSIRANWAITETMDLIAMVSRLQMKTEDSPHLQGFHITNTDLVTNAKIDTDAFEIRLSDLWWGDRFRWSIGMNLSRDDAFERQFADTTNAGALFSVANILPGVDGPVSDKVIIEGEPKIRQRAYFLNTDTEITDALTLTLGLRYTENKQDFVSCTLEPEDAEGTIGLSNLFTVLSFQAAVNQFLQTGQFGDPRIIQKGDCFSLGEDGNNDPFESDLDETNLSGRIALSWTFGEHLLFGSVSRGYKAGGFPVLNAGRKKQLVPVVQEELLAYELGAKLSFFEDTFRPSITVFYYDYADKQLLTKTLDETFGPLPILANAPESEVYGFELDFQYRPIGGFLDGLLVGFSGSYIKTEIKEFIGTNSEGETQDFSGLPFNFAPEKQYSALLQYSRVVTDWLELGVAGDYYYSGKTNGSIDQNPLFAMESYEVLGARIFAAHPDGTWKVEAFGRNLSNELINLGVNSWSEAVTRHVGQPRTYGLRVSYHWH